MRVCVYFLNGIVLVDTTRGGVNANLEIWRDVVVSTNFQLSRTQI